MEGAPIRLDEAREQARLLEDAVAQARTLYGDVEPQALAAYLRSTVEELLQVRARIDSALGIEAAQEDAASLWIHLRGRHVGEGRAPIHTVGKVLEALQVGVRQVAGYFETGAAILYRLPKAIQDEVSLDVIAWAPGSVRIAIAPAMPQLRVDHPLPLAEVALQSFVAAADWAEAEATDDALDAILPDHTLRRQVLSRIKEIAPSPAAEYDVIEFVGPLIGPAERRPGIQYTGRAFGHASAYLRRRQEEAVTYAGQLVAIDVERSYFDLRYERRRIHCRFGDDLSPKAKQLIEMFVEVGGRGFFHEDDETPYRIDAGSIRRLSPVEQARL